MARKEKKAKASKASTSVGEGEVVAVVREWQPHTNDSLETIHASVDALGTQPAASPVAASTAPTRVPVPALPELQARVDRLTRRVKARNVTVTETVTDWVDDDGPVEVVSGAGEAWTPKATTDAPAPITESSPTARGGKRKPRILGWFGPKGQKEQVDAALEQRAANAPGPGEAGYQPQCGALTDGGAQCRNSARDGSKYCASHKGYQPPTAKGIAQRVEGEAWDPSDKVTDRSSVRRADTKPRVRRAKDTSVAVRKAGKRPAARRAPRRAIVRKAK